MKVLKFGGTSVGSVKSATNVKKIVEHEAKRGSVIVVLSALGGITDKLLSTAQLALNGDERYRDEFDSMVKRHHEMVDTLISHPAKRIELFIKIDGLFDQLKSIYYGVFLIHDLSDKIRDAIVSYGELLSSNIISAMIKGAVCYDSRSFVMTSRKGNKNTLDTDLTNRLITETFAELPRVAIVPGFISRDKDTGETTNLGRGGSDYTAALIAAAMNAEVLEIWTDVDGFMTADPRVIRGAYTIPELSYLEATELCNFGAKVIYPPTIYPVCIKDIPIRIKNTFNPSAEGTIITHKATVNEKPIRGISSINDTALITVTGLSMVGVIGVNRRIFTALADNGISVFLVSQASSENSTSIGVKSCDAEMAADVLNEEFAKEIATGAMFPMHIEYDLATVAVVGENMKHQAGVAGKLFGTLGRSGISIIAVSQGASETNISFVIKAKSLDKALNAIHDSFFLSEYTVLNLFVCGVGTVGSRLLDQIKNQYDVLKQSRKVLLKVVGISNSRKAIFDINGIDLENYREALQDGEPSSAEYLCDKIVSMNLFNSIFVDCTASSEIASTYQRLLEHNVSIVAANKIAASSPYDNYTRLKQTALAKGVKFRYETNVGAGLPIIGTISDLCASGDRILKIEAVLSGTLNFILNRVSKQCTLSMAVRQAVEMGLSEPDPRIDLSGKDVIRKLIILTREAGYKAETEDVVQSSILPSSLFEGTIEEFWEKLESLDSAFEAQREEMESDGKRWRFVAKMEDGRTSVALVAVDPNHPFYNLESSNNIVLLTTERYHEYPMLIKGYGAGASVTAAGVFANIMSIANA